MFLAKSNACFSSTDYSASDRFNPPVNGEIYAIKLIHKSGSVTCESSYPSTNWGCDSPTTGKWFAVQLLEDNVKTYYPTNKTQGITYFSSISNCGHGNSCGVSRYEMNDTYSVNDGTIELIDYSNLYQVTTSQTFSLQYSEACCGSDHDNDGTSCADVYFMYSYYEPSGLYIR